MDRLYLVCFPSEKSEEDDDISKKGFKNEAYHCQAPQLQRSHTWKIQVFNNVN